MCDRRPDDQFFFIPTVNESCMTKKRCVSDRTWSVTPSIGFEVETILRFPRMSLNGRKNDFVDIEPSRLVR